MRSLPLSPSFSLLLLPTLLLFLATHTDAFSSLSPSLLSHNHRLPLSLSSTPTSQRNFALRRFTAQMRPGDREESGGGFKFDQGWFKYPWEDRTGKPDSRSAEAQLPSLFLLPLGAGLIGAGLFLPSPELLVNLIHQLDHAATTPVEVVSAAASAASKPLDMGLQGGLNLNDLQNPSLDPSTFVPVCQFSDTFYRSAQKVVFRLAGKDTYQEYAPLIAGSLLRVRLEFCVLESFVQESIIPFVKARGLSWVFPVKETLETFVAGVVFAVASNLVLIGSTKIITIVVSYVDFFFGLPLRLIFGFTNDRLKDTKNPVGKVVEVGSGVGKFVGEVSGVTRRVVEGADIFVGRYLLLTTVGYVILKFLKFKGVITIDPSQWANMINGGGGAPPMP